MAITRENLEKKLKTGIVGINGGHVELPTKF